jgi:flagellar biogenesis protein FliO
MNRTGYESELSTAMPSELRLAPLRGIARFWARIVAALSRVKISRAKKDLRICETVSLGEKRLLAIVEFEGQRLLIGATTQSIVLLPTRSKQPADAEDLFEASAAGESGA